MPILSLVLYGIAAVLGVHALIFFAASQWHYNCIPIIYSDWNAYIERAANPPWYIRYTNWLDANVFKRRFKR